jgi:hypothetical protein
MGHAQKASWNAIVETAPEVFKIPECKGCSITVNFARLANLRGADLLHVKALLLWTRMQDLKKDAYPHLSKFVDNLESRLLLPSGTGC